MDCEWRYGGQDFRDSKSNAKRQRNLRLQRPSEARIKVKARRWEKWAAGFFTVLLTSLFSWHVLGLLDEGQQGFFGNPKGNWEHLRGNDGKFWKGTPDESIYANMEGVRLVRYYQYVYDKKGRLSQINTFGRHDINEYIWVWEDEEIYEYDGQGRVSRRQSEQGDTLWTYEYNDSGYTVNCSHYPDYSDPDIYTYDRNENLIFYRNATNYRDAHNTTYTYDGENRLVRKTLEVDGHEPYVTMEAEYDEEDHTSVETEYEADGTVSYVWRSTYDENWVKTDSVWYVAEELLRGHYTKGYWVYYADGVKMAEISNRPRGDSRNDSEYTAYDYDGSGNCMMELHVYGAAHIRMERYAYDGRNRLKEKFSYDFSGVTFWERQQSDGSRLTLQAGEDGGLSVTRTALDGTLLNRFVFGEDGAQVQYTPEETVYWGR